MDTQRADKYKNKLEKEHSGLLAEIKKREMPESFGSDTESDFEEKSDETEETANRLAEVQAFKDRINEIDSALIKINHGEYGKCEKCGKEIESEKLDADPAARLCKDCA